MIERSRIYSARAALVMALTICGVTVPGAGQCSAGILLYNDSLAQRPADQAWLTSADNSLLTGGTVTETVVAGVGVNLTTDQAVSAGYSSHTPFGLLKNAAFPVLNRTSGFSLGFELQLNDENHLSADRAGFSVLLLSSDSFGIELGFWKDQIWAQSDSPLFTHAEAISFDTTAGEIAYELAIQGNSYSLFGNSLLLLNGSLRNYSAFGGPPYTLSNYLFLGDNTSSAGADVTLGNVSLSTVPEPGLSGMIASLTAGVGLFFRRQRGLNRLPGSESSPENFKRLP